MVNQLSITITDETNVKLDPNDIDLPQLRFNLQPLSRVDLMDKNDTIDLIAIVASYGPVDDVLLRNNQLGVKRELNVVDKSSEVVHQ